VIKQCLHCFDRVGWAAGRASGLQKTEWWGSGVVVCLERVADLHDVTATHCLASVESRLVLPFWHWLTWVVQEKGPFSVRAFVRACVIKQWQVGAVIPGQFPLTGGVHDCHVS